MGEPLCPHSLFSPTTQANTRRAVWCSSAGTASATGRDVRTRSMTTVCRGCACVTARSVLATSTPTWSTPTPTPVRERRQQSSTRGDCCWQGLGLETDTCRSAVPSCTHQATPQRVQQMDAPSEEAMRRGRRSSSDVHQRTATKHTGGRISNFISDVLITLEIRI